MRFPICYGLAPILLLGCLSTFPTHVQSMAELTEAMLKAHNLQELLQAEGAHRETTKPPSRLRSLQELEDSKHILADQFGGEAGFYHGVASGDPLSDAVIVWTRYTPVNADATPLLEFRMAAVDAALAVDDHLDPAKNANLHRATVRVTGDSDFVAKIDVVGLKANTPYVFAFVDESGEASPVGQTKTAPGPDDSVESMVYAVFSCSHFSNGYFHAYDVASTIVDLDFWVHVGDYVYEYGTYSTYATDSQERHAQVLPKWEQISLQDHRNRMATYHTDNGLQNLRRRAPLIATWDDHETTNNPWGQGTRETTEAQNHQETCPANATSPDSEKADANCDRDEGDIVKRFNAAAQSYFEWMPIRHFPGSMGVVDVGSITQVISWGDMATFVTFDTRLSHRSKDPTLNSNTWGAFFPFGTANMDVSQYSNESSPVYDEMIATAAGVAAVLESDEFTLIGQDQDILRKHFEASAKAGQPWQIWATATALGRAVKGDYSSMHEFISDEDVANTVKNVTGEIYASGTATFLRVLTAHALTSTPWNRDDYSGFAHEQRRILSMVKEVSNNPIVLAGDLHDGYAWTLFEDGAVEGVPCAVNLVCPGVTSPGWGPALFPNFRGLSDIVGGDDEVYSLLEQADEAANPGLVYINMQYKGFFAVKATKESHIAEYFVIEPETILTNYEDAREASGGIVADFACDVQVTTTAGAPGSLDRQDTCSVIDFATERPAVWSIPVPASSVDDNVTELTGCGYKQCTFTVTPAETEAPSAAPTEMKTPSAAPAMRTLLSIVMALGALALDLWNRLPM